MPHFGQNMLFMDKVSNSEIKKVGDQHSELIPEVMILVKDKDFLNYLLVKKFQSRFQLPLINKKQFFKSTKQNLYAPCWKN